MTKKRSPFPWRAEEASLYDAQSVFMASACWAAAFSQHTKHPWSAHAHCIARAAMICAAVNQAQDKESK